MSDQWSIIARNRGSHTMRDGTLVELEGLTLTDVVEVRRAALDDYRRDRLKVVLQNLDLLPESMRERLAREKLAEVDALTTDTIPPVVDDVPVLGDGGDVLRDEKGEVVVERVETPYVEWWMRGTYEGMLTTIWLSMRRCPAQTTITKDDVARILWQSPDDIVELARLVGDLTRPRFAPKTNPTTPRRRRVRRGKRR